MMVWLRQSKYGYIWVTFAFFLISFIGQWLFGWLLMSTNRLTLVRL